MTVELTSIEVSRLAESGAVKKIVKSFVRGASLCNFVRGFHTVHFSEEEHYTGPIEGDRFVTVWTHFAPIKVRARVLSYNYPRRIKKEDGRESKVWEYVLKVDDGTKQKLQEYLKEWFYGEHLDYNPLPPLCLVEG